MDRQICSWRMGVSLCSSRACERYLNRAADYRPHFSAPYIAIWGHYLGKWNTIAVKIPRMGWLIISGIVSQGLLGLMHRAGGKKVRSSRTV